MGFGAAGFAALSDFCCCAKIAPLPTVISSAAAASASFNRPCMDPPAPGAPAGAKWDYIRTPEHLRKDPPMKLYMHPVSTTSRAVRLFAAENGIAMDEQVIDLMTGEHTQEPFATINPNRLVPVLEDGDLRLTESSAILKYLADKIGSPAYPKDLKQRAKVNEMMDWINTNFYREWGYRSEE